MEVFNNENHIIILGDAIEGLTNDVADGSIDLIFADPPYNIGKNFNGHKDKWNKDEDYLEWCYRWLDLCIKKLKPNGSFYVMTSNESFKVISSFVKLLIYHILKLPQKQPDLICRGFEEKSYSKIS